MNTGVKEKPIIVSRVVRTAEGKGYLEVDGKPFLMGHVQNCGGQQLKGNSAQEPYPVPLPVSWLENCFEKTAALGYKTISIITKWNEIEPVRQESFDWTIIDHYIDWANKYDLYLDIAWFGSNACGGTRLPGHGRGWTCWVPEYVQNHDKYFGNRGNWYETNSEINCPWLPDGGPHHQDAENLFMWERNAVKELFKHLADKDTNHRTILFQVFNEPNCHSEWYSKKYIWLDLMNQLGKVVKESDYVVATRVNMAREVIDSEVSTLQYIDFVGCNPYMENVEGTRESLYSGKTDIPCISENYGHIENTSSLALTAIIHGGYYCPWQLNDHWEDFGMYAKLEGTYTDWCLGNIPPMRESGRDMTNLNTAMSKIGSLITIASLSNLIGFNVESDSPFKSYSRTYHDEKGVSIGFSCDDGSVAMAIKDNSFVYLISDTSEQVKFLFNKKPISVNEGEIGNNGEWVKKSTVPYTHIEDGSYCIEYHTKECIKVQI